MKGDCEMWVKLNGKWELCCENMKSHPYHVDSKGIILDKKLNYKFSNVGEILGYVDRLERELSAE